MGTTIVILLLISIGLLLVYILIKILSGTSREKISEKKQDRIVVKNGRNIKHNVLGDDKGKGFQGAVDQYDTLLVENGRQANWKLSFFDLNTLQIYRCKCRGKLMIGRVKQYETQSEWLELAGDPKISASHCLLYLKNNVLYLRDMGSKNHTYLNGIKIDADTKIQSGDILKIGETKLKIEFGRG